MKKPPKNVASKSKTYSLFYMEMLSAIPWSMHIKNFMCHFDSQLFGEAPFDFNRFHLNTVESAH